MYLRPLNLCHVLVKVVKLKLLHNRGEKEYTCTYVQEGNHCLSFLVIYPGPTVPK